MAPVDIPSDVAPQEVGSYRILQFEPAAWSGYVIVERDAQHWFLFTSAGVCISDGQAYVAFTSASASADDAPPMAVSFAFVGSKSPLSTRQKLESEGISFNQIVANVSRKLSNSLASKSTKR